MGPISFNPTKWALEIFAGWLQGIGEALTQAYTNLLLITIELLIRSSLPTRDILQGEWYSLMLGGTFGLASRLMILVAIAVALIAALSPTRNHGRKFGRLASTMFVLILFGPLFFPVYALVTDLSRGLSVGLLTLAAGPQTTEDVVKQLSEVSLPLNPIGLIFVAVVGLIIMGVLVAEAVALQLWLLLLLLFYPLSLAARPLGKMANRVFHALNSGIITVLLAPPLMTFGLAFAALGVKYIPLGNTSVGAFVFTLVGGLFAIAAPFWLAIKLYQASGEVFGRVESSVSGALDISSLPPVTTKEMRESVDDSHGSAFVSFASGLGTGVVVSEVIRGNTMDEVKKLASNLAPVAATAAGYPHVAAGIKAVQTAKASSKGGDGK